MDVVKGTRDFHAAYSFGGAFVSSERGVLTKAHISADIICGWFPVKKSMSSTCSYVRRSRSITGGEISLRRSPKSSALVRLQMAL